MTKLKDILSEVFDETPKVDKHKVIEGVRNYGIVGKSLYNNNNIMEIAKQLSEVAESAHHHILGEESDWFDKISVNRNMKSLKGNVVEFQKTAKEAHMLNQRLTALYEDIGGVLNRYYDIDEGLMEDKGDMDNDGKDEPDDEEYMDNKDKAIKKAMKDESLDHDETLADKPDKEGKGRVNKLDSTPKSKTETLYDDPTSPKNNENIQHAMEQTYKNITKKPTRRLKDIGSNVVTNIPALGDLIPRKK